MKCQKSANKVRSRRSAGAVLPFVAFIIVLGIAFVAFCVDVMRTAYASSAVRYAAEAAALGAFSSTLSTPAQSYSRDQAESNIRQAIFQASGSSGPAWNTAPYGPNSALSGRAAAESAVHFEDADITFLDNPNTADSGDYFLQLRGRRDNADSLKLFFLPLIYAFNGAGIGSVATVPTEMTFASPQRLVEIIAQPASRIGAGVPRTAGSAMRDQDLIGFATLPIALSNKQFAALANSANSALPAYNLLLSPTSSIPAGTISGALVNLTPSPSTLAYYNQASSSLNVNQLVANLAYFAPGPTNNEIPSAMVERGSLISNFNLNSNLFTSATVQQQLVNQLRQLSIGRSYIFPVVAENPTFATGEVSKVVGFARLRLLGSPTVFSQGNFNLSVALEPDSVAVRNASFANARAAIPAATSAMMPAPIAPFTARIKIGEGMSVRPRSIVMAPSLSPRTTSSSSMVN